MKTRVILEKDVPNLGMAGDVLEVAPGYARNYLLPRRFAVPATTRHLDRWNAQKEKRVRDNQEKLAAAQEQARKIEELVCAVSARAGEDGKLFGSVTTADVARALAEKGFSIDRRWIELREAVRTTGEFQASVRLHPQVRASLKIRVNAAA
jgi:large subunit ribosomal protein L9